MTKKFWSEPVAEGISKVRGRIRLAAKKHFENYTKHETRGLWLLSGRAPGYKTCGPRFYSRAIPTVPKNFLGTVKWQVKIVQRQHMS